MPKLTAEERAELERQLADDDADDESDEVTVTKPDGSSFTGTFKRALQLGLVSVPEKKPAGKDGKPAPRSSPTFMQRRGQTG
jgi:hypothetical protein